MKKVQKLTEKQKLEEAVKWFKRVTVSGLENPEFAFVPKLGITLGSGLGWMTDLLNNEIRFSYADIPFCPTSGATGHVGQLWFGYLNDTPVVMMQGRVHLYEGRTIEEVVFLTRLMIMMGARKLILTHAVGAVTLNLEPTDIIGIRSHIAGTCPDPTAGPDAPLLGGEFTPMGEAYSPRLLALAKSCALEQGVSFHKGVSHFKQGRTYESLAEVEYMRRAGADVATMSTIPEVISAVHMGAEVLDLALVTNMGAGLGSSTPLSHKEVQNKANLMKKPFSRLITAIVGKMFL